LTAATDSMDDVFHNQLYEDLLKRGHIDTLLRVRGPLLRSWLESQCSEGNNDVNAEMLWRYFTLHDNHEEASRVIVESAVQPNSLPLDRRIAYLSRGVGSLSAQQQSNLMPQLEEAQNYLDVANVQSRIRAVLVANQELSNNLGREKMDKLSNNILSADVLLNEYAAELQLWDFCLIIIHCCRLHDEGINGTIQGLWRTILSDLIPKSAADSSNRLAAKLLKRIHEQSYVQKQDDGSSFEDENWILGLKSKIVTLGNELYGSGADHTFPLVLLAGELESLRRVYNMSKGNSFDHPWPLMTFLEVGCPYAALIQAYDNLARDAENEGADIYERVHFMACIAEIISKWVSDSNLWIDKSGPQRNQLSRALGGGLRDGVLQYRAKLEAIVGGNTDEIARVINMFDVVEQQIRNY